MKNIHKILIAIGTVLTLFLLTASLTHASLTPVSWIRDTVAGFVRPGILTDTLRIPSLTNCDTIDTDADGDFACGTDSGGGGSGDITAVGDVTTGDAFTGTAGTTLTFNNAGGDGILDYDGTDFNFDKSISLGTAGVRLSGDGDGAITFRGLGNGSDEDLTLNLDDTSNVGTFSSSTGLSRLSYSNIEQQDGGNAWKLAYNNSSYFGNGSGAILRTGFGGVTSPSAKIHIGAGTTGANTAPLMFTAGTNMTTPQAGAIEFDGTDLFYTDSTPTRQTVANLSDIPTPLVLQTDGSPNGDQTLLNLKSGTNITLTDNGAGSVTIDATGGGGLGDFVGPASSTDNAIVRFDSTTGKLGQNSGVIVGDSNDVSLTIGSTSNVNGLSITQNDADQSGVSVVYGGITGDSPIDYPFVGQSNDAGNLGPFYSFYHNSASPAVNDLIGGFDSWGKDSAGNNELYGYFNTTIVSPTSTTEIGGVEIGGKNGAGGFASLLRLRGNGVGISDDSDGAIRFFGLGDGSDEDFTMNLDDTANTNVITSSTGLNLWTFTGMGLNFSSIAGSVVADVSTTNTGTSTTTVVTPDGLAGSYAGSKELVVNVLERNYTVTTGDRKACVTIPSTMNGMNIVEVGANVYTTSSSGTPTIQIARGRQASATSAHSFVDVLSTRITIDANEYDSKDATTAPVINTSNDDLATGDLICGDIDVTGTGTKGLSFRVIARLP